MLPLPPPGTVRTGTSTTVDSFFGDAMTNSTPFLYTDCALSSLTDPGNLAMSSNPTGVSDGSPCWTAQT